MSRPSTRAPQTSRFRSRPLARSRPTRERKTRLSRSPRQERPVDNRADQLLRLLADPSGHRLNLQSLLNRPNASGWLTLPVIETVSGSKETATKAYDPEEAVNEKLPEPAVKAKICAPELFTT